MYFNSFLTTVKLIHGELYIIFSSILNRPKKFLDFSDFTHTSYTFVHKRVVKTECKNSKSGGGPQKLTRHRGPSSNRVATAVVCTHILYCTVLYFCFFVLSPSRPLNPLTLYHLRVGIYVPKSNFWLYYTDDLFSVTKTCRK